MVVELVAMGITPPAAPEEAEVVVEVTQKEFIPLSRFHHIA